MMLDALLEALVGLLPRKVRWGFYAVLFGAVAIGVTMLLLRG